MRLYAFIHEIKRYMPYSGFMPAYSAQLLANTFRLDKPDLCIIVLPY